MSRIKSQGLVVVWENIGNTWLRQWMFWQMYDTFLDFPVLSVDCWCCCVCVWICPWIKSFCMYILVHIHIELTSLLCCYYTPRQCWRMVVFILWGFCWIPSCHIHFGWKKTHSPKSLRVIPSSNLASLWIKHCMPMTDPCDERYILPAKFTIKNQLLKCREKNIYIYMYIYIYYIYIYYIYNTNPMVCIGWKLCAPMCFYNRA